MSTEEVTAYRTVCDVEGCDHATEPTVSPEFADEAAVEAGWDLSLTKGRDRCPACAEGTALVGDIVRRAEGKDLCEHVGPGGFGCVICEGGEVTAEEAVEAVRAVRAEGKEEGA